MSRRFVVPLALLLVVALAGPAAAITYPTPDNGAHPQVGQLLFYVPNDQDPRFVDPGAWFNCSGTLLSPTVLLTAGHCTYDVGLEGKATSPLGGGKDIWVTFDETASYDWVAGIGSSKYAPYDNAGRYAAWSAALDSDSDWFRGTAYTHPSFNPYAFFMHDAGIVVLDEPVVTVASYGELPYEGYLDQFLRKPKNEQRFTPVGYGLNRGFPLYVGGDTRMQASVMLVNTQGAFGLGQKYPGTAVVFSNNNGKAHKGGTCFGDSGGPIFDAGTMTIVAVTSFGVTQTCTGTGGGYRIDQADDLSWIGGFLVP